MFISLSKFISSLKNLRGSGRRQNNINLMSNTKLTGKCKLTWTFYNKYLTLLNKPNITTQQIKQIVKFTSFLLILLKFSEVTNVWKFILKNVLPQHLNACSELIITFRIKISDVFQILSNNSWEKSVEWSTESEKR